jgi:hypothetical protein
MASSAFRGQHHGFTFDNYVSIHQDAHDELFNLEEVVPESKKVTTFLKGILDPHLMVGKQIVLGDPAKMGNFELCQQYLSTLIQNTNAQSKLERNVSSATTGGGGKSSGSGSLVDKIKGGSYSSAKWANMSQPDRDRVKKFREEGNKKRGNKSNKYKRKQQVSKVKSGQGDTDDEDDQDQDETAKKSSGAGAQFGANGNKKQKGPGQ